MTKPKRLTIHDIARFAGVSAGTVSRVINGQPGVGDATRLRIQALVQEHSFRASFFAKNLPSGRSFAVGLVFASAASELFAHPIYPELIGAVGDALTELGYMLTLITVPANEERCDRVVREMSLGRLDGVILPDVRANDDILNALLQHETPAVVIGHREAGGRIAWVDCDHDQATFEMTRLLLDAGHKRIAFVNGPSGFTACQLRIEGYRAALLEAGIPPSPALEQEGPFTSKHGYDAARQLLAIGGADRPTAIAAASDLIAAGCMDAAKSLGLRVPADVAITGFDDNVLARFTEPPLTTVRMPLADMGKVAVQILMALINGDKDHPSSVVLPAEVVARESSGGPSRLLL
ncbi:MAG: LacI family DNA-binding transcriptional regulator [Candidatus Dormibacteraceae bacterium]